MTALASGQTSGFPGRKNTRPCAGPAHKVNSLAAATARSIAQIESASWAWSPSTASASAAK
eukprot:10618233-Lingulodinium_polyedra.AAC.1